MALPTRMFPGPLTASFGWRYDFYNASFCSTDPIPDRPLPSLDSPAAFALPQLPTSDQRLTVCQFADCFLGVFAYRHRKEAEVHTITPNEKLRFIEVRLEGLCSMEEFQSFTVELRSAIARFPSASGPPATLYDFTGATIQTQEVVRAMKALAEHPSMTHRRVAMYTEGVLARQQAKRICENRSNMFVFASRVEALDWLASSHKAP